MHQILSQWAQTNDRASDGLDNNNIDDYGRSNRNRYSIWWEEAYTQYLFTKDTSGKTVMEKAIYIEVIGTTTWSWGSTSGSYTRS